jgi:hypothetical protein
MVAPLHTLRERRGDGVAALSRDLRRGSEEHAAGATKIVPCLTEAVLDLCGPDHGLSWAV